MVIESTVPFLQSMAPNLFGVLYTGPTIVGFIIGFLAGVIMHKTPNKRYKTQYFLMDCYNNCRNHHSILVWNFPIL